MFLSLIMDGDEEIPKRVWGKIGSQQNVLS